MSRDIGDIVPVAWGLVVAAGVALAPVLVAIQLVARVSVSARDAPLGGHPRR